MVSHFFSFTLSLTRSLFPLTQAHILSYWLSFLVAPVASSPLQPLLPHLPTLLHHLCLLIPLSSVSISFALYSPTISHLMSFMPLLLPQEASLKYSDRHKQKKSGGHQIFSLFQPYSDGQAWELKSRLNKMPSGWLTTPKR